MRQIRNSISFSVVFLLILISSLHLKASNETLEEELISNANNQNVSAFSALVVRDGDIIWNFSYGEGFKGKIPTIDSIYNLASITKTVTATAVMTLVEDGLIDLDSDINTYLPFYYEDPYFPDTVTTMRMLISHTAGFVPKDSYYASVVWNANLTTQECIDGKLIAEFLNTTYPQNIVDMYSESGQFYRPTIWSSERPPGEHNGYLDYSNYGFTLAAYIVELVSNSTMENYILDNIFHPIGAYNVSYSFNSFDLSQIIEAEPAPGEFADCYDSFRGNGNWPDKLEFGAAELKASPRAMSKFMMMHMNGGEVDGTRILTEESITMMHEIIDGDYGLGWWWVGGWSGHGGRGLGYRSEMRIKSRIDGNYGIFEIDNGLNSGGLDTLYNIIKNRVEEGVFNTGTSNNAQSIISWVSLLDIIFVAVIIKIKEKRNLT